MGRILTRPRIQTQADLLVLGRKPVGQVLPKRGGALYDMPFQGSIGSLGILSQPTNAGTTWRATSNGPALHFDGSSYLDLGTASRYALAKPILFEFGLSYNSTDQLAVLGTLDNSTREAIFIILNSNENGSTSANKVRLFCRDDRGLSYALSVATTDAHPQLSDGRLHRISVFLDGSTRTVLFYIDGRPVGGTMGNDDSFPQVFSGSWDYPLVVGALNNRGTIANYFTGQIHYFRMTPFADYGLPIGSDFWSRYRPANDTPYLFSVGGGALTPPVLGEVTGVSLTPTTARITIPVTFS